MFLIRCYVGVAFEIFVKGKQSQQNDPESAGKKRKREQQEEEEAAAAAAKAKNGNGKKQNKRSKGKKNEQTTVTSDNDTQNNNNENNNTTEDSNGNSDKWTDLTTYLTILEEGPLCPLNFDPDQPSATDEAKDYVPMPHGPDGLRYHLMDIWIDELEKVLEFEEQEQDDQGDAEEEDGEAALRPRKVKSDVPMDLLLRPIENLRTQAPHKPVRVNAAETLEDERLFEWGFKTRKVDVNEEEDEEDSEGEWGGFD